jgi:hypothetical protein
VIRGHPKDVDGAVQAVAPEYFGEQLARVTAVGLAWVFPLRLERADRVPDTVFDQPSGTRCGLVSARSTELEIRTWRGSGRRLA